MRTHVLPLSAILAACASAQTPGSTSSSAPPPTSITTSPPSGPAPATSTSATSSTAPDAATVTDFFTAIRGGDDAKVEALLAQFPALADARSPKGRSAFLVALARPVGETFVRPQENRVLAAILARHPTLDALEAAAAGDVARVELEIERDPAYVRAVHAFGWTPLHLAAFGGQPRVAELLLAHGAEVDARAKNEFANTPLQVGLLTAQEEIARLLVAHGANVNAKQNEGFTALHEATQSGKLAIMRFLLDAGADANATSEKGVTPLSLAIKRKNDEAAALLRAHGARG